MSPPPVTGTLADMAGGLGVMCFAFIGIELASTMADEIRNPERDVPRSVVITGLISLAAYLLVADALLALVPAGELGAIQGVMQAVHQGAVAAGASWLVAPIAIVMAIAIGGSASAWFAGPARIPFVAGLNHALPAALGRVHPRWGSPYVALIWCAIVSAALTALSFAGSSVAEAYQVLLRAAVVHQPGAVRLRLRSADDAGRSDAGPAPGRRRWRRRHSRRHRRRLPAHRRRGGCLGLRVEDGCRRRDSDPRWAMDVLEIAPRPGVRPV